VRLRIMPVLVVSSALAVGGGFGVAALTSGNGAALGSSAANLSVVKPFTMYLETSGGCYEARIKGRDVDPPGFVDQENDECVPSQHVAREPDGRAITSSSSTG
jgi:hypothetical protein